MERKRNFEGDAVNLAAEIFHGLTFDVFRKRIYTEAGQAGGKVPPVEDGLAIVEKCLGIEWGKK